MNIILRISICTLLTAALVALTLAPAARGQDAPDQNDDGDRADDVVLGFLHNGELFGHEPGPREGEASDNWILVIYQGDSRSIDLDVSAVLDDAKALEGKAVLVGGQRDGAKLIVDSITEKEGGIVETIEGVLGEPQIGFDDGALGWHIMGYDGRVAELNHFPENVRIALEPGARVRAELQLGIGHSFYEDAGYVLEFKWTVLSLETLEGLADGELDGIFTLSQDGPGVPPIEGQSEPSHLWYLVRANGSITPISTVMLMVDVHALKGKAVAITGEMDADNRFFTAMTMRPLEDGITRTIEGTLGEPQIGFDDGALDWHVVTADGATIELTNALEAFGELVGMKVRVEVRLVAQVEFFEASGSHLAAGWEAMDIGVADDQDENEEEE